VNFKQYFLREFLSLSSGEEKATKMGLDAGNKHHQKFKVGTNLDRKKVYLVAKDHTRNEHQHTLVTKCKDTGDDVVITKTQADEIMKIYEPLCPSEQEPSKAIKQTGVHLVMTCSNPRTYILQFKGESKNGEGKIFKQRI
jgi:hypothetical protein